MASVTLRIKPKFLTEACKPQMSRPLIRISAPPLWAHSVPAALAFRWRHLPALGLRPAPPLPRCSPPGTWFLFQLLQASSSEVIFSEVFLNLWRWPLTALSTYTFIFFIPKIIYIYIFSFPSKIYKLHKTGIFAFFTTIPMQVTYSKL